MCGKALPFRRALDKCEEALPPESIGSEASSNSAALTERRSLSAHQVAKPAPQVCCLFSFHAIPAATSLALWPADHLGSTNLYRLNRFTFGREHRGRFGAAGALAIPSRQRKNGHDLSVRDAQSRSPY
ncbi:MAG: hypothetical protein QOH71_1686 [Blastocatellia bacterium]|nr:hypothetical protein [Blastocatellia bacterium]